MTNEAKQLLKDKPELCKEIATMYREYWMGTKTCGDASFEAFLKEHTAKPDWEILSFKETYNDNILQLKNGLYDVDGCHDSDSFTLDEMLNEDTLSVKTGDYIIHSVRRLSYNEVFTVGDETDKGKIYAFRYSDWSKSIYPQTEDGGEYLLSHITKRTPLFTTEDGKVIFARESYIVVDENYEIHDYVALDSDRPYTADLLRFSTRSAAEQWVEDNKPRYSIADLKKRGLHI